MDNESALDVEDAGNVPPVDYRQRRASHLPRTRTLSVSSVGRPSQSTVSTSPRKEITSLPRARVNSILTRGLDVAGSAPSPLAQIYQPMFFGGDAEGDLSGETQGHGEANGMYGSRRRLPSMPRRDTTTQSVSAQAGAQRVAALSESPNDPLSISQGPSETASQVEDGGSST